MLVVFLVHWRPWQVGLLEEWGLAQSWEIEGWAAYTARLTLFAARPLHLLPHYLGLALPGAGVGGGFGGEFLLLGLVATAQVVVAVWALAPLTTRVLPRWGVAVVLGLHPWWLAGDILRFLPAQVAILGFVVWLGLVLRFLVEGSAWRLGVGGLALLAGLLTYQAVILSSLVAVVLLAVVVGSGTGRAVAATAATAAVVVVDVVYTLAVVPRLFPDSYENTIRGSGLDVPDAVRRLVRTVGSTPGLIGFLVLVSLLVVVLAVAGRLDRIGTAVRLLAVVAAPGTAVVLAASATQLNDPDRVGQPVGLTAWVVLATTVGVAGSIRRTGALVPLVVLAVGGLTVVMTVVGYLRWTHLAHRQEELLDAVAAVRADVPADAQLVVADRTGTYGDVYTLLPPYLDIALSLRQPGGPPTALCTPAGVERKHPDADIYPIVTTPVCEELPGFADAQEIATLQVDAGSVIVYRIGG